MKPIKIITISIPAETGREIQKIARDEKRTISELLNEYVRQYKAQHVFRELAKKGKALAKKKKLTPKDFGGPFEA